MEKAVVGAFYRLVVDCNSVHDRYGGQLEGLALSGMGHVTDTLWNAYLPRYLSIYLSIYLYIYQYIYLSTGTFSKEFFSQWAVNEVFLGLFH